MASTLIGTTRIGSSVPLYEIRVGETPGETPGLVFKHGHKQASMSIIYDPDDNEAMYFWRCTTCGWVSPVEFCDMRDGTFKSVYWSFTEL